MARFNLWGLLFVFLPVISESRENPTQTVSASQKEDATLPCFKPNTLASDSCYRVKWTKLSTDGSGQPRVILARPLVIQFRDAERVEWGTDGNGYMALSLKTLNKSDEGVYSCEVWDGWERILVKNIQLKVKVCKTLDAVKAASGTLANLRCPVDAGSEQRPLQNGSWVMLKAGVENPIFHSSKIVEMNGTLLAIRVDVSDSGWFRCKYLDGRTQHCFDLKLQVQGNAVVTTTVPPTVTATETVQAVTTSENVGETKKKESGTVFITLMSSLTVGLALIAALMGLIIYSRCSTKRPAQNAQRNPGVFTLYDDNGYDNVELPCSQEHMILQDNNLYSHFKDEEMNTFQ